MLLAKSDFPYYLTFFDDEKVRPSLRPQNVLLRIYAFSHAQSSAHTHEFSTY